MADFREEIIRLQDEHTKTELIGELVNRTGKETKSVNPLTETMFSTIAPEQLPVDYARRADGYSADMSPVAVNATALKILLHERVGRPLYNPVERLVKQDFAECIAAIDAYHEGLEQGMGEHVPTTLPLDVAAFVQQPPTRSGTPDSPFKSIIDLDNEQPEDLRDWISGQFDDVDSTFFVYVLDCTPLVEEEPQKIWDRRRAIQTKVEADVEIDTLEPVERAIHALNQSHRVYYVGSTGDVPQRVRQHLSGTDKSGVNFTNSLPPRSVVKVEGCDSRQKAKSLEGAVARELNDKDGLFAYSDEM